MTLNRRLVLAGFTSAALSAGAGLRAQERIAGKPVRLIVGFPPGGPTDVVARVLGESLHDVLGQPVLVENRAGAAGNLAADYVAKAPADGTTLLYASSAIAISPALYEKLSFDVLKSFVPLTETVSVPMVLLVNNSLPATYPEFIRYARANPGKLNYASSGNGTITHLAAALFSQQNGLAAQHIAYKGTAPALTDLIGGTVQFTLGTINTAQQFVAEKKLRALAVTGLTRAESLPGVPTLDELGMKGFEASAWQGVMAPAGTPAAIVGQLSAALTRAMQDPRFRSRMAPQDAEVIASSPTDFGSYLNSEVQRWARVVKDTGAKAE